MLNQVLIVASKIANKKSLHRNFSPGSTESMALQGEESERVLQQKCRQKRQPKWGNFMWVDVKTEKLT